MSKKKQRTQGLVDTGRGVINDNVYAAMVTSKLFTAKVEKPKKGKGQIGFLWKANTECLLFLWLNFVLRIIFTQFL